MRGTCVSLVFTWIERKRAGSPNKMDVKLKRPQMARVTIERMRKLFGGGYSFGVGPLMGVTGGWTGAWERNECLHLYKSRFMKDICHKFHIVIIIILYQCHNNVS